MTVGRNDFIPRVDPYYYKMFIISKMYVAGCRDISI